MLYNWTLGVSGSDWRDIVDKNLTKGRKESLGSYEPRMLFSRQNSPLYLTDMLALLKDPRTLPFLGGRRALVIAKLGVINKYRKDAHANEILSEEMAAVREAFDILEPEFLLP